MQYGAVPYKMRPHEDDKKDGVSDNPGQRDHIVDAAVEDPVDDVIHVVLLQQVEGHTPVAGGTINRQHFSSCCNFFRGLLSNGDSKFYMPS